MARILFHLCFGSINCFFLLKFTLQIVSFFFFFFPSNLYCKDMSDIDEKQLVLYAQMANLVNSILQWSDINIKEIAENFSKVFLITSFWVDVFLVYSSLANL